MLGRLSEAEEVLKRSSARKLEMPEMLVMPYYIAYLNGDQAGMEQALRGALIFTNLGLIVSEFVDSPNEQAATIAPVLRGDTIASPTRALIAMCPVRLSIVRLPHPRDGGV